MLLGATTGARAGECGARLTGEPPFVPGPADHARLVDKIVDRAGEGKYFDGIDQGNRGTHLFLIPHEHAARFVAVTSALPGGRSVGEMAKLYDPTQNIFAAVLETADEPELTVLLIPRDAGADVRRAQYKLNPVDSEDNQRLRELVPGAWTAQGDFESHHLLWAALNPGVEIALPWRIDHGDWSIDAYR